MNSPFDILIIRHPHKMNVRNMMSWDMASYMNVNNKPNSSYLCTQSTLDLCKHLVKKKTPSAYSVS